MKDILSTIIVAKRIEVAEAKLHTPMNMLERQLDELQLPRVASLASSLASSPYGIIAEFKRKSPSKGWIKADGDASSIPLSYQNSGASALSILTDKVFFGGTDDDIRAARKSGVTLPVLYKNFVIDEYQLLQARLCGASAVLLIASALSLDECKQLRNSAKALGLEVLLEMHTESELAYADCLPEMCGINNRNLGTFTTSVEQSLRFVDRLPSEAVKISESGISDPSTVNTLRSAGFRGFLIGERLMREDNPGLALHNFIAAL